SSQRNERPFKAECGLLHKRSGMARIGLTLALTALLAALLWSVTWPFFCETRVRHGVSSEAGKLSAITDPHKQSVIVRVDDRTQESAGDTYRDAPLYKEYLERQANRRLVDEKYRVLKSPYSVRLMVASVVMLYMISARAIAKFSP